MSKTRKILKRRDRHATYERAAKRVHKGIRSIEKRIEKGVPDGKELRRLGDRKKELERRLRAIRDNQPVN